MPAQRPFSGSISISGTTVTFSGDMGTGYSTVNAWFGRATSKTGKVVATSESSETSTMSLEIPSTFTGETTLELMIYPRTSGSMSEPYTTKKHTFFTSEGGSGEDVDLTTGNSPAKIVVNTLNGERGSFLANNVKLQKKFTYTIRPDESITSFKMFYKKGMLYVMDVKISNQSWKLFFFNGSFYSSTNQATMPGISYDDPSHTVSIQAMGGASFEMTVYQANVVLSNITYGI